IAAATGLPTPVGWGHHEMQWRGWSRSPSKALFVHVAPLSAALGEEFPATTSETIQLVRAECDYFYESPEFDARTLAFLSVWGPRWLVIGSREYERFAATGGLEKFSDWDTVFQSGGTRILRVPVTE